MGLRAKRSENGQRDARSKLAEHRLSGSGPGVLRYPTPAYELYLNLNGIEHRRTKVRNPKTNGFVERFNGTVLNEFFRIKIRETFDECVAALRGDLDTWMHHYNTERPHLGYRNKGRRPIETINPFVSLED